jgi:hypothetical protein
LQRLCLPQNKIRIKKASQIAVVVPGSTLVYEIFIYLKFSGVQDARTFEKPLFPLSADLRLEFSDFSGIMKFPRTKK